MGEVFKKKRHVAQWLKENGWDVAQSTVYKHIDEGRLIPRGDGVYTEAAVRAYAKTWLPLKAFRQTEGQHEVQDATAKARLARLMEQTKLAKFKREVLEGKYVLREDVDRALYGRGSGFENTLKGRFHAIIHDLVASVDGDDRKAAELLRMLEEEVDQGLTDFAAPLEFTVSYGEVGAVDAIIE